MTYKEYEEKRTLLGLTNGQVSKLSGVSSATLSQWKNGVYEPKRQTLAKIKHLLDTYNPDMEIDYYSIHNDGSLVHHAMKASAYLQNPTPLPLPMPKDAEMEIQKIPKLFTIDSVSVYLNRPMQLSERQYQELVRSTEAFIDSWIKLHKNDKGV